jgi:hypothetical protein
MKTGKLSGIVILFAATALLAGCREYRAVVEIDPDGAGTRTVVFDPEFDESLTGEDMPGIFGVTVEAGWAKERDASDHVRYRKVASANAADGWADLGGDIRVYTYGDGEPAHGLTNEISLETGRTDEGRTYTYRERLEWTGLKRELTNVMTRIYESRVRSLEPALPDGAVGELRGLFRVHFSSTWKHVGLSEDTGAFAESLTLAMEPDVKDLVARLDIDVSTDVLLEMIESVIEGENEELETVLDRDMPGVSGAFITSVHLTVAMPGEIIDSNGTIDEDGNVYWQFGLLDPIDRPLELHVRSLIRD